MDQHRKKGKLRRNWSQECTKGRGGQRRISAGWASSQTEVTDLVVRKHTTKGRLWGKSPDTGIEVKSLRRRGGRKNGGKGFSCGTSGYIGVATSEGEGEEFQYADY